MMVMMVMMMRVMMMIMMMIHASPDDDDDANVYETTITYIVAHSSLLDVLHVLTFLICSARRG